MFINEKTMRRFVEELAEENEYIERKGDWYSDKLYLDQNPNKEQWVFVLPTYSIGEKQLVDFLADVKKAAGKEWAVIPMRTILEEQVVQYSLVFNETETLRKN